MLNVIALHCSTVTFCIALGNEIGRVIKIGKYRGTQDTVIVLMMAPPVLTSECINIFCHAYIGKKLPY